MEKYLYKGIKEIIEEFPAVAPILDEYGIGCGPCAVGTCLLKDIVSIHGLPKEQEKEMMARIAKTIYPDKEIEVPRVGDKKQPGLQEFDYSPPMKKLVDEHVLIKRWAALIPEVIKRLDVESERRVR